MTDDATEERPAPRKAPAMVTPLPRPELIHQLQMRQLELEIENEALRESVASLQKSEARNDLILERLPAALLVVDAQGRVIRANKEFTRFLSADQCRNEHRRDTGPSLDHDK
jgi:PAS domain-containing protein